MPTFEPLTNQELREAVAALTARNMRGHTNNPADSQRAEDKLKALLETPTHVPTSGSMAIWRPEQRPILTSRDGVLAVLDRLMQEIRRDGSMEGAVTYSWGEEPDSYLIQCFARTGNDMGQGGAMILQRKD